MTTPNHPPAHTALNDLIARLEKATGPDRELDSAITRYLAGKGPFPMRDPAYTASLDAAMTLVPEGWGWSVSWEKEPETGKWGAFAWVAKQDKSSNAENGYADQYAIALCIASLRARKAMESANG